MMDALLVERLERIRNLLQEICHVAIATVNEDGSPHNTPVFGGIDNQLRIYWALHPNSMHSQNIARTGQAYIVLFDSIGPGGGLFINAKAKEVEQGEFDQALKMFNEARAKRGRDIVGADKFTDSVQRLYVAEPLETWVNLAERNEQGNVIRDYRHEISLNDLSL